MKTPPDSARALQRPFGPLICIQRNRYRVSPGVRASLFAIVATLAIASTSLSTEPKAGMQPDATNEAVADAAELEALSVRLAKLERELDAKLASHFDTLSEQLLNESMGSLAAVHDARLRQRIQLSARIDQQLVSLSRTPNHEYDAFAADRAATLATAATSDHRALAD